MNIDPSYFTSGRRQILNASICNEQKQNTATNRALQGFIDEYARGFLVKVFGAEKADRILETSLSEADDELRKDFNDIAIPLADYVMYHILRDTSQQNTMNGVVVLKNANEHVSPAVQQAKFWNEMVDAVRAYCLENKEVRVDRDLLTKITSCCL